MLLEDKWASAEEQMLARGLIWMSHCSSVYVAVCVRVSVCTCGHMNLYVSVCLHMASRPAKPSPLAEVAGVPVSPKRAGFYVASSS